MTDSNPSVATPARGAFRRWIRPAIAGLLLFAAACATATPEPVGGDEAFPFLPTLQVTRAGDQLTFALDVTNVGEDAVEVMYRDGQSAEFSVQGEGGRIWRWSDGQMFTQAIRNEVWEPGETRRYEAQWVVPADLTGDFQAFGTWLAMNRNIELTTAITLP